MEFCISLLNVDWTQINLVQNQLKHVQIRHLHLDIMDGHLTDRISFGMPILKGLAKKDFTMSGHFMVKVPQNIRIEQYLAPYTNFLTSFILQYEGLSLHQRVEFIEWGQKFHHEIGLAIDINTNWEVLKPFLPLLDYVLVMLVSIGRGGQSIQTQAIPKITELQQYCRQKDYPVQIIADGGINFNTIIKLPSTLEFAVVGSYCWEGESIISQLKQLNHLKPR